MKARVTSTIVRLVAVMLLVVSMLAAPAYDAVAKGARKGSEEIKSKFYDFSEQLIDGDIKQPTALYTDARQQATFERLLRLKKELLSLIFESSKERALLK